MTEARGGDLVCSYAAIGGGDAPLGFDEFCFEEALERGVEGAFFDLEEVLRALVDVLDEGVSVGRLAAEGLEDHHLEGAGEEIAGRGFWHRHGSYRHRVNR
jgi:hypothetical protein